MGGKKKLTLEYVKEYIHNEGYELLSSEYINAKSSLQIKCNKGHVYISNWNRFQYGTRCPYCVGKYRTIKEAKEYFSMYGYIITDNDYISSRAKMNVLCPNGHKIQISYNNFTNGKRCLKCDIEKKTFSYEYVKSYIKNFNYTLLDKEYKNSNTKLNMICNAGHVYSATFDGFKRGKRCPYCKTSNGENKIANILKELKITYIRQYSFNECKNINRLSFDFYLPKYNLCIEYDGQQHFKPVDFSGKNRKRSIDEFTNTLIRDAIKNQYCEDNNINLLRIPFWDFDNIEEKIKTAIS